MAKPTTTSKLSTDLSSLKLSTSPSAQNPSKKAPVADSWDNEDEDDEAIDDATEEEEREDSLAALPQKKQTHKRAPSDFPDAPPPTPSILSPSLQSDYWSQAQVPSMGAAFDSPMSASSHRTSSADENKRPEKSTAVASRLIAAGLGVKAPKRTEEQRAYEKSVREQERKRKEKEIQERKRAEEERERAKRSVWED